MLAAAYGRYLADWCSDRPPLDPGRWGLARLADDMAYGAGVWWGCAKEWTVRPLLPDLSDWPGRSGVESEPW